MWNQEQLCKNEKWRLHKNQYRTGNFNRINNTWIFTLKKYKGDGITLMEFTLGCFTKIHTYSFPLLTERAAGNDFPIYCIHVFGNYVFSQERSY